jgi:hypothetical protein
MSGVIFKGDPRYFEQTSDAPYDRHTYRIVFTNGNTEDYPSWDVMRARWFAVSGMYLSHVEVIDIKEEKKGGKGFA